MATKSYTEQFIRRHVLGQFPGLAQPEDTVAYKILESGGREALADFIFNKCPFSADLKSSIIDGLRMHYSSAYACALNNDGSAYTVEELLDITQCWIMADYVSDGQAILRSLGI